MEGKITYPAYRWLVEAMIALATIAHISIWMAPAPLLPAMIADLRISMAQAGLIVSMVSLCVVFFSLLGGLVTAHLGLKRTFMIGLWVLGIGALLTSLVHNYSLLLATRVVHGIGYGLILPILSGLVMRWFPLHERPYMNMINVSLIQVGFVAVYVLTVPLFELTYSWRAPFLVYGAYTVLLALVWTLIGREGTEPTEGEAIVQPVGRLDLMKEVIKIKDIGLLILAYVSAFWVWQTFATFLPTYYVHHHGMDLCQASVTVSLLSVVGIMAAILGGIGTGKLGLRKPFMWPLQLISMAGCIGAITTTGPLMKLSLTLMGIGTAGWMTALFTIPMELPGMTAVKVAIAISLIRGLGYIATFLSPVVGGWMAESVGLFATLFAFAFLRIVPAIATFLVTETGPRARRTTLMTEIGHER